MMFERESAVEDYTEKGWIRVKFSESKAFAKSTVARTVRAPGVDWWKESAIDCERRKT